MAGHAFLVAKEVSSHSNHDNCTLWEWFHGENVLYFYEFNYIDMLVYFVVNLNH